MEFVDGQTLQEKLNSTGPLDPREVLHLGRQMAAGLAAAHEKGLIHRDIKPGNILLEAGAEFKVKITDFGLARAVDDASMTRTGTIAGTPMYMAPEQVRGQTLDHRADLFSLGSVLYQMACGRPPFRGADALAVMRRVVEDSARPIQDILSEYPDWLCAIIEKLHAKNPDDRYQTAKEVADLLARCQNELQVNGQVTSVPVRPKATAVVAQPAVPADPRLPTPASAANASSRRPLVAVLAAAILLILGLGVTELTGITHLFRKPSHESVPESVPVADVDGDGNGDGDSQAVKATGPTQPPAISPRVAPSTDPSSSPAIDFAAERGAAEWALRLGGSLQMASELGQPLELSDGKLPDVPFVVREISLIGKSNVHDEDLAVLRGCRRLQKLNLDSTAVTGEGLAQLAASQKTLEWLILGSCKMNDAGMASLAGMTQLRRLDLIFNVDVTDAGLRHLKDLTSLEYLVLPQRTTDAGLASLPELRGLRELWFSDQAVTDVGVAQMIAQNPQLESLRLCDGPRTVLPLAGMTRLCELHLDGQQLTLGGLRILQALPRLESIHLNSNMTAEQVARIGELPQLRQVDIYYSHGDDPAYFGDATFTALTRISKLEKINVHGHLPSPTDAVLQAWAGIPTLKVIWLGCDESKRQYTADGIARFRELRPDVHLAIDGQDYPPSSVLPRSVIANLDATDPAPPWELPAGAPPPVVAPSSPEQATTLQRRWAEHLQRPVIEEFAARHELGLKFALIPPGEFFKIFTRPNLSAVEPDMPVRRFRITKPYALSTTEITWDQFRQFVEATGYQTEAETSGFGGHSRHGQGDPQLNWRQPGWTPAPHEPVVQITTRDAAAFCAWLSQIGGATYRLPTEAEWQYACRAGSIHQYVVADPQELANDAWTSEFLEPNSQVGPVHAVGQKKPNPFGVHDMLGNVWERLADNTGTGGLARYLPTNDPRGLPGERLAGSSYSDLRVNAHPEYLIAPHARPGANIGFRVVKQLEASNPPGLLGRPWLLRPGQPLSVRALVPRPEPIPGLRSWSVELAGPEGEVESIAASRNGEVIATGSSNGKICLWDREGNFQQALLGHEGAISSLDFSADGQWLASTERIAGERGIERVTARIWNVETGAVQALIPLARWGTRIAYSPSGQQVAITGHQPFVIVDLVSGNCQVPQVENIGWALAWSPDGKALACVHSDQRLRVWDAKSLRVLREAECPLGASTLEWSPDGKWLAMRSADANVVIRDAQTLAIIASGFGASGAPSSCLHAWLPDSRRLVAAQEGSPSGVFDAMTGEQLAKFELPGATFTGLALRTNGTEVVGEALGRLHFYDTSTGKKLREGKDRGRSAALSSMTLDGREVFSQSASVVSVFNAQTGQLQRQFPVSSDQVLPQPSLDGKLVALQNWYRIPELQLVHATSGTVLQTLAHGSGNVTHVAWSPKGTWLATGATDKLVRVWNVATGKLERELAGHTGTVWSLAWSPDGRQLASAAEDKTVRVWDPEEGALAATYDKFPEDMVISKMPLCRLAWTSDSRRLWIALSQHVVPLDVATGTFGPMEKFSNGNTVISVTASPDGQWLLSRELYNWTIVRGRDAQDRRLLGQFLGSSTQWHPDSRRFLGWEPSRYAMAYDVEANHRLGVLLPWITGDHWLCLGPTGHYRGSPGVEQQIVYVAMHDDGSQRTYTPAEFTQKFGWKNAPEKATLLQLSP
jgi:WD40 repeat protein/formylglycine-generating enzyme required for sulfatase activity